MKVYLMTLEGHFIIQGTELSIQSSWEKILFNYNFTFEVIISKYSCKYRPNAVRSVHTTEVKILPYGPT